MSSSGGSSNRLADYFVICGLDLTSGLEPDRLSSDTLQSPPLERSYKCKVLGHYPDEVPWHPFDKNAVCMMCLPHGLQFRTQKHSVTPKFHSFVITRADGSRTYGASYIFYEEIRNPKICNAMQVLQSMHLAELSEGAGGAGGVRVLAEQNTNSRSLPRHFKIAANNPRVVQKYYDATKDTLFVAKSIALLGELPYVRVSQLFLTALHRYMMASPQNSERLSPESYVFNLLFEVSVPLPGRSLRVCCFPPTVPSLGADPFLVVQRPSSIEELPLFDFPLRDLFSLLGTNCVIQLFTCVLLENQVMFSSSDYQRLMLVAESLTTLLFPFAWQHVYVPILPASLQHFLDAPVPFIMGLHSCEPRLKIASEANLCYLDIDTRTMQLPEEVPSFPQKADFIAEINNVLSQFHIETRPNGAVDRNLNDCSRKPPSGSKCGSKATSTAAGGPTINNDIMSTSCTLPSGQNRPWRKMSWTEIEDSTSSGSGEPADPLEELLAITRRAGASVDDVDSNQNADLESNESGYSTNSESESEQERYSFDLRFNNALREVFLSRFVQIFVAYEQFVILPNKDIRDKEQWLSNRESVQNFDKATFLSDQPESQLPFLSRFIESQMFATLVDNKILSMWGKMEPNLRVFERRIHTFKKRLHAESGLGRSSGYLPSPCVNDSALLLEKRLSSVDVTAPHPQEVLVQVGDQARPSRAAGGRTRSFPLMDSKVLNPHSHIHKSRKRSGQSRHRRDRDKHHSCTRNSAASENAARSRSASVDQNAQHASRSPTSPAATGAPPPSPAPAPPGTGAPADPDPAVKANRQSQLYTSDLSPAVIAQANWTFVETMLTETKNRTKRMLVEKIGTTEAVELGHGLEGSIVEENTLIGGLCDLLERIWSHGLQEKQGKSALWSHLVRYQLQVESSPVTKPSDPSFLMPVKEGFSTPYKMGFSEKLLGSVKSSYIYDVMSTLGNTIGEWDLSSMALEPDMSPANRGRSERCRSLDRKQSPSERKSLGIDKEQTSLLKPLPTSISFDIRNVQSLTEIRSDIGYAWAFVRLSLEKKLLSKHLRALLSDKTLLSERYKRYAFLRCEEEKDQFLYHLLTLNAVDYFCFTNTYPSIKMPYRVIIFPSRKYKAANTTANCWVTVAGSFGETGQVAVPRGRPEFVFQYKNLGLLTTLRIGHDDSGQSPKWMVEHVIVRNEMTGHTYKFPCGRWLGRGIDDGSSERLLVGELVPSTVPSGELAETCSTPPRCRSPSIPRDNRRDCRPSIPEIQRMLGDCVNNIVKLYFRQRTQPAAQHRDNSTLTVLLCGEMGLVTCLEQVFCVGFKSARLFAKNLYLWDYFVKVREQLAEDQTYPIPTGRVQQQRARLESLADRGGGAGRRGGAERADRADRADRAERWERTRFREPPPPQPAPPPAPPPVVLAGEIRLNYCDLVEKIDNASHTLGKDGKFQIFVCLAAREHLLSRMLPEMASCRATAEMYEESSFLRDPTLLANLVELLASLDEFDIVLESSITKGISR